MFAISPLYIIKYNETNYSPRLYIFEIVININSPNRNKYISVSDFIIIGIMNEIIE